MSLPVLLLSNTTLEHDGEYVLTSADFGTILAFLENTEIENSLDPKDWHEFEAITGYQLREWKPVVEHKAGQVAIIFKDGSFKLLLRQRNVDLEEDN
jgi:hypothetical protein